MSYRLRLKSCVVVRLGLPVPADEQSVKRSGRPETITTPAPRAIMPDRLRVLYPSGQLAYMASGSEARYLVRAGLAESYGSNRKIYYVQLFDGPATPVAGTKYSSRAETATNPPNVFALKQITHHPRLAYCKVQTDCVVPWRESLA